VVITQDDTNNGIDISDIDLAVAIHVAIYIVLG
jgi:hypothetical protein